jgi:hypothetical protein
MRLLIFAIHSCLIGLAAFSPTSLRTPTGSPQQWGHICRGGMKFPSQFSGEGHAQGPALVLQLGAPGALGHWDGLTMIKQVKHVTPSSLS